MSQPVIPNENLSFTAWVSARALLWSAAGTGAQIGLSSTATAAATSSADDAVKALAAYTAARAALDAARDEWYAQKSETRALFNADIALIRTFARNSANPAAVFAAAEVPAPKTPVDGVAPGQVTAVKATLNTVNGQLRLTWKCNNPGTTNGTVYTIERRIGVSGAFTPLGLSSVKNFVDYTLPASAVVQYNITATRSGLVGTPSGPVSVVFGHASNGEAFIQSVSTGGVGKLAA